MLLTRACRNASFQRFIALRLTSSREYSTKPSPTPPESDVVEKQSTSIVPPPQREVLPTDVISGAPSQLRHRTVRIYKPTRNTMQSGGTGEADWVLDWDVLQGAGRWENPLMGYASSADYMQRTQLSFRSREDAAHYAEKHGWDYHIQTPTIKRIPPKNYAENFLYRPGKLRLARTK